MESLLDSQSFLKTAGAVLAIATALLGVITGVAQFTGKGRARRAFEWAGSALATEQNEQRRAALERIRTASLSYLVSAHHVPLWRFAEHIFWLAIGPPLIFTLITSTTDIFSLASVFFAYLVVMLLLARRALRLYAERLRIAHRFNSGLNFVEPKLGMMDQMEGGTRSEFGIGALASFSLASTSVIVAWIIASGMDDNGLLLVVLMLAMGMCWLSVILARRHATSWARR